MRSERAERPRAVARARVWIERGGRPVIGPGRAALLEGIERTGSLAGAARETGVTYRTAWGWLARMSAAAGRDLVERRHGGSQRGGMTLTPSGHALLEAWQVLIRRVADLEREMTDRVAGLLDGD